MALVDLNTGKILGAKKGTLKWYHENGHLVYNKSDKGIKLSYHQGEYFQLSLGFVVLTIVFLLIGIKPLVYLFGITSAICYLVYFLIYQYEEWWCWRYAKQMMDKKHG